MKLFYSILFLLLCLSASAQDNYTLSGYVTNAQDGETMIGVKVFIPSIQKGAITNNYGFYSLTVPKGVYFVEFRVGGQETETKELDISKDLRFDFEIGSNFQNIEEVVVDGKAEDNVKSTKLGQIELDIDDVKKLPAFMGEVDII